MGRVTRYMRNIILVIKTFLRQYSLSISRSVKVIPAKKISFELAKRRIELSLIDIDQYDMKSE